MNTTKKSVSTKKAPTKKSAAKAAPAKEPATKKARAKEPVAKKAAAKKTPQVEITAIAFETSYLDETGDERTVTADGEDIALAAGTWFAVSFPARASKRFLYVLQVEDNGTFVLYMLADRDAEGAGPLVRLPGAGAFMRALVTGALHVLGANTQLSREQIAKHIGGHEPPPQQAKPPYT